MSSPNVAPAPVGPSWFGRSAAWALVAGLSVVGVAGLLSVGLGILLLIGVVPAFIRQGVRAARRPVNRGRPADAVLGTLTGLGLAFAVVGAATAAFVGGCFAGLSLTTSGKPEPYGAGSTALGVGVLAAALASGGLAYLFCWLLDRDA